MGASVVGKIDVRKIDKTKLFAGAKGTYLDIALIENKDGADQYGNDGFVVQSVSKAAREAGERGPIIGNWRYVVARQQPTNQSAARPAQPAQRADDQTSGEADNLPF